MVVIGCPCNFRAIVARLREEAGDINDGSHDDGAGVRGDRARWMLGGALVGVSVVDREVLSVVVRRPGSERCHDLNWLLDG